MPWEVVFSNASPYAIALVLIWLIVKLLKFVERLLERLDSFRETLDHSIAALQLSAEAQRELVRREEQAIEVQRDLCLRIARLEEQVRAQNR